ncbi:IS66 family insertion sequence element accessory protein TnpA [Marinobacterium sedimentorum]|uniref:IS66 family insertion sequence element accessory protein TnpA n=1 Tax=Marinobacterium sedimentorum TaxID=2927804 RepID=UPI0020C5B70E|nr:hypothetical protein [Marinobacterium sedimentorum]MCP8689010.1 hypothetical protein [Marinobacterium sedimentorum]
MTEYTQETVPDELKEAFWHQHLEAWKASGLTQRAYCQEQGLTPYRMTYWKGRLAATPHPAQTGLSDWVLMGHGGALAAAGQHLNVCLPNGIRLEIPLAAVEQLLPGLLRQLEPQA